MRALLLAAVLALIAGETRAAQDDPPTPSQDALDPRTVVSIHVEGLSRFREDQVLEALGIRLGEVLDPAALDDGMRRAFDAYHILAAVDYRPFVPADASPGEPSRGLEVLVHVQEVAVDLEPRFVGNTEIDRETLLSWVGLEAGAELYFNQIDGVRRDVIDNYLREGFAFVEVDIIERVGGADVVPDVIFEIREGPRVHVRGVEIRGNDALPDRGVLMWKTGLSKYADVQLEAPFLRWFFKTEFVEEDLQADLVAMREVYRDRGWLDAIVEVDRLEFSDDRDWVTVHVAVDEGERYRVASLDIEAVERVPDPDRPGYFLQRQAALVFPEDELLALCELRAGAMYSELIQRQDTRDLALYYGDHGYVLHPSLHDHVRWEFLDPLLLFDYERKQVQVTYRIAQGRQLRIRDIHFEGTGHTRDRVVRRLLSVFPGDLANVREIQRSLNRIRSTGFFDDPMNPGVHPQPEFRFDPTGDPGYVDLTYVVEEGQVLEFNLSGGAGSNYGVFGQASLRMRNFDITNWPSSFGDAIGEIQRKEAFHGAGQDFQLLVSPGTEVSRFRLAFSEPDIFQRHIDRISFSYDLEKRFRIYDTHDEERLQSSVRFGRQLTPDSAVFLGFGAGNVKVDDIRNAGEPSLLDPLAVPSQLVKQEGTSTLSWVEVGFNWRVLDNAMDPKDGHRLRVVAQLYDDALGSDFEFVKGLFRSDIYRPLGEGRGGVPAGIVLGLDAGVAVPTGGSDSVPYTERFFIGGSAGPRGFDFRGVGPNENGDPIGGETMLTASIEYRVPLITSVPPNAVEPVEAVRGILFVDAGVLDPRNFHLDFDELRASVGFGVGLTFPLPISLTFGFPIRKGEGDEPELINFSLGF